MPNILRRSIGPYNIYERRPKPLGVTKYYVGKIGEAELHDFGRYSTAIRWAKQQMPRPVPTIVIDLEDKSGVSNLPVNFILLDGEFTHKASAVVDPDKVEAIVVVAHYQ